MSRGLALHGLVRARRQGQHGPPRASHSSPVASKISLGINVPYCCRLLLKIPLVVGAASKGSILFRQLRDPSSTVWALGPKVQTGDSQNPLCPPASTVNLFSFQVASLTSLLVILSFYL